ncbi:hypothetical protein SAMN04487967_1897 [Natronorubrum sediminis]|uniref:Uncharacterized protein n=1 Tax=Natronorubrum sediminis TaxID=640943 RepID=A0A1H6FW84_9EURY|nr:hypothetical protein SAMN04487967_1897 [Natronorubrum sediminis]
MALIENDHVNEEGWMDDCIDNCFDATQACNWRADEYIEPDEEMARCIRLCRDVAGLTTMNARAMIPSIVHSQVGIGSAVGPSNTR